MQISKLFPFFSKLPKLRKVFIGYFNQLSLDLLLFPGMNKNTKIKNLAKKQLNAKM